MKWFEWREKGHIKIFASECWMVNLARQNYLLWLLLFVNADLHGTPRRRTTTTISQSHIRIVIKNRDRACCTEQWKRMSLLSLAEWQMDYIWIFNGPNGMTVCWSLWIFTGFALRLTSNAINPRGQRCPLRHNRCDSASGPTSVTIKLQTNVRNAKTKMFISIIARTTMLPRPFRSHWNRSSATEIVGFNFVLFVNPGFALAEIHNLG